ncbi:MAG: hypothetical protein EZS28_033489, partial [Streblomastix strix]
MFGEIHFRNLGRSSVALRKYQLGETVFFEEPLVRSFPPEQYFIELCDKHEIDRMFGVFLIGYAFAEEPKQNWISNQMYAPDESTLDVYTTFRPTIAAFCPDLNQYLAQRYVSHPLHWTPHIEREPLIYTSNILIHMWLIWNTNSHSFNAFFEQMTNDPIVSKDENLDPPYNEVSEEVGGEIGTAIFEVASRVPHSCAPNMSYVVKKQMPAGLRYRCVRRVKIGELLSFSYIESYDIMFRPTSMRRADLMRHKYFFCLCPRCRAEDMTRPLFCPDVHVCKTPQATRRPGQLPVAVRCDVEGWSFMSSHPDMFGSEEDEDWKVEVSLPE